MGTRIHRSTPEPTMDPFTEQPHPHRSLSPQGGTNGSSLDARLRIIHDLIRSGDYHVSAAAIAERMIEQMIIERRGRS